MREWGWDERRTCIGSSSRMERMGTAAHLGRLMTATRWVQPAYTRATTCSCMRVKRRTAGCRTCLGR